MLSIDGLTKAEVGFMDQTDSDGKPVGISLPQKVVLEVVEADPVVKGQTAASSYKPAIMSNGVRVMVPPFITAGTRIVVNTEEGTYLERAKD